MDKGLISLSLETSKNKNKPILITAKIILNWKVKPPVMLESVPTKACDYIVTHYTRHAMVATQLRQKLNLTWTHQFIENLNKNDQNLSIESARLISIHYCYYHHYH